jgi:MFS family permease
MSTRTTSIKNIYLFLLLLNTLAASLIWGINTLFLLEAGLTNTQAFAANAFFTLGQMIFEVPTGVIADSRGRRTSYLLGTVTLAISTLLYLWAWYIQAPFGIWAATSILLGLGFTFFSGASEAWLVDALHATESQEDLEPVLAKGQIVSGIAMLTGSVTGGFLAQVTNLGVPYILRAVILILNFAAAFWLMHDLGFSPQKRERPLLHMKQIFSTSLTFSFNNRPVRWIMLAAPFGAGVGIYAFYAMQPYLLELYGNTEAYGIAGLAAAIVAGAQIIGGLAVTYIRRWFRRRTSILILGIMVSSVLLLTIGLVSNFWLAILILIIWGLIFALTSPIRQTYLNNLIPSDQRATILSFDALISSSGGVIIQPTLGKAADFWGYSFSYIASAGIQLLALPFTFLARQTNHSSDNIKENK